MLFQVLGSLTVDDDIGNSLDVGIGKPCHLMALFLLKAGQSLSRDWLIDHLWPGQAPRSAWSNLKTYIVRLRRLGIPIVTRRDGYVLVLDSSELDAHEFERLARAGREALHRHESREAAATFETAALLWRGDPLQGMDLDDELSLWAERLHEEHRAATEYLFDAQLSLGRHREIIGTLLAWTARYPLRERPHGQLMIALYRDGRQAEALEVFQRLRHRLVETIGAEPTPPLRELQRWVLDEHSLRHADLLPI